LARYSFHRGYGELKKEGPLGKEPSCGYVSIITDGGGVNGTREFSGLARVFLGLGLDRIFAASLQNKKTKCGGFSTALLTMKTVSSLVEMTCFVGSG
jgi:hypothetical protein